MSGGRQTFKYGLGSIRLCSDAGCTSNAIQLSIMGAILLWSIYEFLMHLRVHRRLLLSWHQLMLLLMSICLVCDICFSVWSNAIYLYLISALAYELYFTTLVYYFTLKYLQKHIRRNNKRNHTILIIAYVLFCAGDFAIFVFLAVEQHAQCRELGNIVIDGVMISLGVGFFFLAYSNQSEELRKIKEWSVIEQTNNPLQVLWVWVCCNIIGQIANQVQNSLIYNFYKSKAACYSVTSNTETDVLAPLFLILTYGLSFTSTLWFYNRRRRVFQEARTLPPNVELSPAQVDVDNRVELIRDFGSSERSRSTVVFPRNFIE